MNQTMSVQISEDICDGCGICVDICPLDCLRLNENEKAIENLKTAISFDPEDHEAYTILAGIYRKSKKLKKAKELEKQARNIDKKKYRQDKYGRTVYYK